MTSIGGSSTRIFENFDKGVSATTGQKGVRPYATGFGAVMAKIFGVGIDVKDKSGNTLFTVNKSSWENFAKRNGIQDYTMTSGKSIDIEKVLPQLGKIAAQQNMAKLVLHTPNEILSQVKHIRDFISTVTSAGIDFSSETREKLVRGKHEDQVIQLSPQEIQEFKKAATEFLKKFNMGQAKVDAKHAPEAKAVAHDVQEEKKSESKEAPKAAEGKKNAGAKAVDVAVLTEAELQQVEEDLENRGNLVNQLKPAGDNLFARLQIVKAYVNDIQDKNDINTFKALLLNLKLGKGGGELNRDKIAQMISDNPSIKDDPQAKAFLQKVLPATWLPKDWKK